jgi:uncharacterized protein (DUF2267 family)
MAAKNQNSSKKPVNANQLPIDIGRMYQFRPDEMVPEIRTSSYSNVSYITCTNRDVFIDFLEMPGIKKDRKMTVPGTRIYLSHSAARQLAAKLTEILEGSYHRGKMEFYKPGPKTVSDSIKNPAKQK